jgi:hypothetical protein
MSRPFRSLSAFAFVLVASSLAACDEDPILPDGGLELVDAGVDAATTDGGDVDAAPPTSATALVVAGDFSTTGVLSTIDLPAMDVHANAVAGVASADPVVRVLGDEIFVVNRFGGDNVTILGKADRQLVQQIATGAGTNPQDVAVVGRKLYVAALGAAGVLVIDRDAPGTVRTIDLSSLDPDGIPDCVSVHAIGSRLVVVCGVLDHFVARGPGKVSIIDTARDRVVDTFELAAANPLGMLHPTPRDSAFGGDLLMPTVPSFTDYSVGCLARISTGVVPASHGCAVTNQALGGYATHAEAGTDTLWISVATFDAEFNSSGKLIGVDLDDSVLAAAPLSAADQNIQDVAVCPNGALVAADVGAAGVRIFASGGEVTTSVLDIGLPPGSGNGMACF